MCLLCSSFSTRDLDDVVKQFREELDSIKSKVEALKLFLTKEVNSLRSDYKKDIETLTQQLEEERTKVATLQIDVELLRGTMEFQ